MAKKKTTKKPAKKEGKGRPTKYDKEYVEQANSLALLGMTNEEMAQFFGIGITTFENWMVKHKDFRGAILEGREIADAKVAKSLYKRANGYNVFEEKAFSYMGQVDKVDVEKHIPPDTQAASLWLRNRQPKKWRDKQEIEHGGNVQHSSVDLSEIDLPLDVKRQVLEAIRAKKKENEENEE